MLLTSDDIWQHPLPPAFLHFNAWKREGTDKSPLKLTFRHCDHLPEIKDCATHTGHLSSGDELV